MKKIRKAVIPAAGFGTRFLPATKAMPKEMLPIVDKPTIQYIVEEILESGINEILIISGHAKRITSIHLRNWNDICMNMARWNCLRKLNAFPPLRFTTSVRSI